MAITAKPLTFTALERKEIKASLEPRALTYVETLEQIAREADLLMQAHEGVSKSRVQLGRMLSVVNFMA